MKKMEVRKLTLGSELLSKAWAIYEDSFPENEQRPLELQVKAMRLPNYSFYAILEESQVAGLLAAWEFGEFIFIEHIAIKPELCGKGIGTKMLAGFVSDAKKLVLLETDLPKTVTAKRRIKFYEKRGFRMNDYEYIQPPYSKEKKPVRMRIMSNPSRLTPKDFAEFRNEIHAKVYECEKPVTEI